MSSINVAHTKTMHDIIISIWRTFLDRRLIQKKVFHVKTWKVAYLVCTKVLRYSSLIEMYLILKNYAGFFTFECRIICFETPTRFTSLKLVHDTACMLKRYWNGAANSALISPFGRAAWDKTKVLETAGKPKQMQMWRHLVNKIWDSSVWILWYIFIHMYFSREIDVFLVILILGYASRFDKTINFDIHSSLANIQLKKGYFFRWNIL